MAISGTAPVVRLHSLTSLRWFAASAVFLHHVAPLFGGTPLQRPSEWVTSQGAVGVSFFFMLSGFVLAWSYRPDDTVGSFYRRRFARIAPAYWVAAVFGVLVAVTLGHQHTNAEIAETFSPFTGLQAWVPYSPVYYGGNGVSWSLSVEVFFYALFPFVIGPVLALNARRRTGLLVALLVAAIAIPAVLHPAGLSGFAYWLIYICPATRMVEFTIGICLCALLRDGTRITVSPTAAGVVVVAAYLAAHVAPRPLTWVAVTVVPFALLIFACAQADVEERRSWLHAPALIALGVWSYSFYLVHQMMILVWAQLAYHSTATPWRIAVICASYAASIIAAWLLYRYVEHPFERRIRLTRRTPEPAFAA